MNKKLINAQKTRQRIIDCALKLFAEKGYKNVTVDEIIEKANSSKGAFYNHFPSKDLLIYEIIKFKDAMYVEWSKEMNALDSAAAKLKLFSHNLFSMNSTTPDLSPMLLTMEINNPQISDLFLDKDRYIFKLLNPIFEEGKSSGEIKSRLSTDELTRYFLTITTGVLSQWCIHKCSFDIVSFGDPLVEIFINGLVSGYGAVKLEKAGTEMNYDFNV